MRSVLSFVFSGAVGLVIGLGVGLVSTEEPIRRMQIEATLRGYGEIYYVGSERKFMWYTYQADPTITE